MGSHELCPSCGYNFTKDGEIDVDGFTLTTDGMAAYAGERIEKLTPSEIHVLYAVAKAKGKCIGAAAIGARFSDSEEPAQIVNVFVCRIRKTLAALGIPSPIETVWHRGYRWALPA